MEPTEKTETFGEMVDFKPVLGCRTRSRFLNRTWRGTCGIWLLSIFGHGFLFVCIAGIGSSTKPEHSEGFQNRTLFATFGHETVQRSSGGQGGSHVDTTLPEEVAEVSIPDIRLPPSSDKSRPRRSRPVLEVTSLEVDSVFGAEAVATANFEETSIPRDRFQDFPVQQMSHEAVSDNGPKRPAVKSTAERLQTSTESGDFRAAEKSGVTNSNRPQVTGQVRHGAGNASNSTASGFETSFFGTHVRAKRFLYLIDSSESMVQNHAMQIARDELASSMSDLKSPGLFQVVCFNMNQFAFRAKGEQPRLLLATPTNQRLVQQFVKSVHPESGTDRFAALKYALSFSPDVIFLLTDADVPSLTETEFSELRRLNRSDVAIHVVEFTTDSNKVSDNFLKRLAREHSGTHKYHVLQSSK